MSTFLIDRAAYVMLNDYAKSSYAPWVKITKAILIKEDEHANFGQTFLNSQTIKFGQPIIQKALNKWWRIALNSFGPPRSAHHDGYIYFGLKYRSNEERREAFRKDITPRISALGLDLPKLFRDRYPFV